MKNALKFIILIKKIKRRYLFWTKENFTKGKRLCLRRKKWAIRNSSIK